MRGSSDFYRDKGEASEMNDKDLERLLGTRTLKDSEDPRLTRFLEDFDAAYPRPPVDHCAAAHLSAIFAEARQLAEADDPAAQQANGKAKSASWEQALTHEGRNWMARRFPKLVGVKLAVVITIIVMALGGVALAGGLAYHQASSDSTTTTVVTEPGTGGTELDGSDQQGVDGTYIDDDDYDDDAYEDDAYEDDDDDAYEHDADGHDSDDSDSYEEDDDHTHDSVVGDTSSDSGHHDDDGEHSDSGEHDDD